MNGLTVKKVDKLIRHGAAGAHLDDWNLDLLTAPKRRIGSFGINSTVSRTRWA